MKRRILVTGARAPTALNLIRKLSLAGFDVYAADCLRYPLSRVSNRLTQYFVVTSPVEDSVRFISDLERIVKKHGIDLIIPTCEEVFFISRYKDQLEKYCRVFCDDFSKLSQFHNKYVFLTHAENCGARIPETTLIDNPAQLVTIQSMNKKVFKPVFSRFAAYTLICPAEKDLLGINISRNFPWVVQEYIEGTEYCSYSIAVAGKLQAHSCYQPTYRAGLGSGIYFTPVINEAIQCFVSAFVSKHQYTGQIGFDFILTTDNELYVLECNPRATSGIHCFPDNSNWNSIFSGNAAKILIAERKCKMISLAMLLFGLKYIRRKTAAKFFSDFLNATDSTWQHNDLQPSFYQFISLGEIIYKSITHRLSLKQATTIDIEWNGETL